MFGPTLQCQSCNDFDVCKKCHGRIDEYHDHIRKEDGRPHEFKFREGREQEFQDLSTPSSPRSAGANESERGNDYRGRRTPEATPLEEEDDDDDDDEDAPLNELVFSDDSDELDFYDPNDTYEDEGLVVEAVT